MIGGNFVSWYGGFDSYIIAREIGNPMSLHQWVENKTKRV